MKSSSNGSKLKMMSRNMKRSRNNGHNPSLIKYSGEASSRLRTYSLSSGYRGGGSSSASSSPVVACARMKYIAAKLEKLTEEMRQDRAEYKLKVQAVYKYQAEFARCRADYEGKAWEEAIKQDVVKNSDEIQVLKNSSEEHDKRILDLQQTVNVLQLDIATMKMNNFFPWSKFPELF